MILYALTCSSDNTFKVFNVDDNFSQISSKSYDAPVIDIFQSFDYENNEYFIISLGNGSILGLDMNLETIFTIPSKYGSTVIYLIISR